MGNQKTNLLQQKSAKSMEVWNKMYPKTKQERDKRKNNSRGKKYE